MNAQDPWRYEPRRIEKPWGYELIWALTGEYCGKLLHVHAGHSLSLQLHRRKDESWLVESGRALLELGREGDEELAVAEIGPGDAFHYAPGTVHRVTALEDTTILEVSTPHLDVAAVGVGAETGGRPHGAPSFWHRSGTRRAPRIGTLWQGARRPPAGSPCRTFT